MREAMDALMFAAPAPFAELAAKARVARLTDDDDIGQQLMFDIGRLAGDIDPEELPPKALRRCEPQGTARPAL